MFLAAGQRPVCQSASSPVGHEIVLWLPPVSSPSAWPALISQFSFSFWSMRVSSKCQLDGEWREVGSDLSLKPSAWQSVVIWWVFAKGLREPIEMFEAIACPHHDLSLKMVRGLLLLGCIWLQVKENLPESNWNYYTVFRKIFVSCMFPSTCHYFTF